MILGYHGLYRERAQSCEVSLRDTTITDGSVNLCGRLMVRERILISPNYVHMYMFICTCLDYLKIAKKN